MAASEAGRARAARRAWERLFPGLALLFVAAPALVWRGHVLDEEAVGFLRKYWGERGILEKIFDVRGWDFYQGRELSYAIDYLDAQWVRLLVSRDVLFLLPPSAFLASLAFVLVGLRLAPRALPSLGSASRWLALLVLLSNFVFVSTMGLLYRATKPLVAPLVLTLLLLVLAELRAPRLGPRAAFAASFALSLPLGLLDRQGLFYVLAVMAVLGAAWLHTRRGLALLLGALVAVVVWYAYFRGLGPWLIHALEGYWPQTRFQRLRPARLLQPEPWRLSVSILLDWTAVLLGGLPARLLLAAGAAGAASWAWRERRRPGRIALAAGLAAAAFAGQLTMVAIMVERHPPVAWISHRLWYYPFPYQAVVVFLLLWGLDRLAARNGGRVPLAVPALLAGLVVLNVARWPELRARIDTDPAFSDQLRRSALLVRSLQQGQAEPLLDGDHRRFYFECLDTFPRFAARARSQVAEGEGILVSQIQGHRVLAWTEPRSHLALRTATAGRYVLAGRARLREGDSLQVLLGTPARLVGEVRRSSAGEGDEAFRVTIELSAGTNDVQLLSRLPPVRVPDASRRVWAGYQLLLPVASWRVPSQDQAHPILP
jgi:hypothetical protein